jgi:O-antigen ligase
VAEGGTMRANVPGRPAVAAVAFNPAVTRVGVSARAVHVPANNVSAERVTQWLPCLGVYAYLFFTLSRLQDWWPPLLNQPVDYYCFAIIFCGIFSQRGFAAMFRAVTSEQAKWIWLYIAIAAVTIVLNGATDTLVPSLTALVRLFVVFTAFAAFPRTARAGQLAFLIVIVIAALIAYQGRIMIETGVGWAGQPMYWGGRIRWVGEYDGANVLCMLFVIAIAFAIHLTIGPWGVFTRILAASLGGLIVYGVYLTASRGGFLALVVVAIMTVIFRRTDKPINIGPVRLLVAGVTAVLLLSAAPARMDKLNDDAHSSAGRIDSWQEGLEMMKATRMMGVGYGQWQEHHYLLAHNSIVQTLGEMGLAGLFAWLAVLYSSTRAFLAVRVPEREPRDRSVATAALVAMIGFTSCSYFITTTQFDLLYIFAGLSVAFSGDNPPRLSLRDLCLVGVVAVLLLVSVYVTVRVFYALA